MSGAAEAITSGVRDQGRLQLRMCCWALTLSALVLIWAPRGCSGWSGEDSKRLSGG